MTEKLDAISSSDCIPLILEILANSKSSSNAESFSRISATVISSWEENTMSVPPAKSTPKLNPFVNIDIIETMIRTAEIIMNFFLLLVKSNSLLIHYHLPQLRVYAICSQLILTFHPVSHGLQQE